VKRRELLKLSGAGALALTTPRALFAKAKQSYRGKHGTIDFTPDTGDGFLLEVSGIKYKGKLDKSTISRLKAGASNGDHTISIDGLREKYSIEDGVIKFDARVPVIEPIQKHVGPVVVIILIIIIIHGKWPPKPGRRVTVDVDGTSFNLDPV